MLLPPPWTLCRISTFVLLSGLMLVNISSGEPFAKQLTIYVEAGRNECVYQHLAPLERIFVEYQVIDGGRGELDINFLMADPHHVVIAMDEKVEAHKHQSVAKEAGVYSVCFENQFSTFNRKTVSFLLEVVAADDERKQSEYWSKEMIKEYHMDQAMTSISGAIKKIHFNLMRTRQLQDLLRTHEARDRNLAEANCEMVNTWSLVQFAAMIVVGVLQVYMLRSIFDTNARFYRVWRKF